MEPATILINGNVAHHAAQREGGAHFAPDASHTNYLIFQCFEPLDEAQRARLTELGVGIQQVMADNTYFGRYDPHDLTELRSLPFLHFVNPYHPGYVVERAIKAGGSKSANEESHDVYITPHDDCASREALGALAEKIAHRLNIDSSDILPQTGYLRMLLKPQDLDTIAKLDEVRFITEVDKVVTFNWTARRDINVLTDMYNTASTRDQFEGLDELVGVADKGIDVDHPAFMSGGVSRVTAVSWRQLSHGTVDDLTAHGTHVVGSVAGSWNSPGIPSLVMGTAPKARIFFQTLFERSGSKITYPPDTSFQTVMLQAKSMGVSVHTNSWGGDLANVGGQYEQKPYSVESVNVDQSAWDYRNITILFAAGNHGRFATNGGQIGAFAAGKNCITVGACEPSHPLSYDYNRTPVYRYQLGQPQGNPDRLGFFSSAGPTQNTLVAPKSNSRFKPDVVAPGVCIYSVKSRQAQGQGDLPTQNQKAFDYLGTPPDNTAPNNLFNFQQGTSMATPLVAGCCVAIRKALRTCLPLPIISSAMIKAVLINGTTDMTTANVPQRMIGRQNTIVPTASPPPPPNYGPPALVALTPTPSPQQGFGRINLAKSLLCVPNTSGGFGGVFPLRDPLSAILTKGRIKEIPIVIPVAPPTTGTTLGPLQPKLTVTMCYTDAPSVAGSGSLVNILAMKVKAGTDVMYGNKAFGDSTPDKVNNVQKAVWPNIPEGTATIFVGCFALNWGIKGSALNDVSGGQDFALAWYLEWIDSSNNPTYKLCNNIMTSVDAISAVAASLSSSSSSVS